jgi:hypothetical protein
LDDVVLQLEMENLFILDLHRTKADIANKEKKFPWARLLARVFNIDVETCAKCGGKMRITAAIEESKVIRKILGHMGLDTKPPRLTPCKRATFNWKSFKR